MSEAWPWAPPLGWCTMTRAFGSAKRLSLAPEQSSRLPMLAAWPMQTVLTGLRTYCMVS